MDLKLIITESPTIEEFHDAIGINVVIPATGIPICGIFVWGRRNADLRIYETSLLRTNAKSYIAILQLAADLADMLHANDARTLDAVKRVLAAATQSITKFKLSIE